MTVPYLLFCGIFSHPLALTFFLSSLLWCFLNLREIIMLPYVGLSSPYLLVLCTLANYGLMDAGCNSPFL